MRYRIVEPTWCQATDSIWVYSNGNPEPLLDGYLGAVTKIEGVYEAETLKAYKNFKTLRGAKEWVERMVRESP